MQASIMAKSRSPAMKQAHCFRRQLGCSPESPRCLDGMKRKCPFWHYSCNDKLFSRVKTPARSKKDFLCSVLLGYNDHLPPNFDNGKRPLPEANTGPCLAETRAGTRQAEVNRPKEG